MLSESTFKAIFKYKYHVNNVAFKSLTNGANFSSLRVSVDSIHKVFYLLKQKKMLPKVHFKID